MSARCDTSLNEAAFYELRSAFRAIAMRRHLSITRLSVCLYNGVVAWQSVVFTNNLTATLPDLGSRDIDCDWLKRVRVAVREIDWYSPCTADAWAHLAATYNVERHRDKTIHH